jgi:hypothetical protein
MKGLSHDLGFERDFGMGRASFEEDFLVVCADAGGLMGRVGVLEIGERDDSSSGVGGEESERCGMGKGANRTRSWELADSTEVSSVDEEVSSEEDIEGGVRLRDDDKRMLWVTLVTGMVVVDVNMDVEYIAVSGEQMPLSPLSRSWFKL